jgi:hypothetical protein
MTVIASVKLSAPATQAAATSPALCPTIAPGRMPSEAHSSARPTCSAKFAGCSTAVSAIREACSSADISSIRDQPASGVKAASQRSIVALKTGFSWSS